MSQAGIINVIDNNPEIPITFVADAGSAVALFNIINILGSGGITTSGAGNTITINGAGIVAAMTLTGNSGGALSPTANNWNIFGAAVAAGTSPVSTAGVVSTITVNVQRSQAIAVTNASNVGLAAFNSAQFTVDANGFVSLAGGALAVDSFTTDVSGPVAPDATGNVAVTGATNIFSDGSVANTLRLNLQGTNHALYVGRGANTASANLAVGTNGQVLIAATGADPAFATITSTDGSITFTPGANTLDMVVAGGTTVGKTITGDTGGALPPTAGNWNIVGGAALSAGTNASVTSGSGSTLTVTSINTAKWIVDATANRGTHTTITGALTAASSGETIFIRPGTYTENLTLKAGVYLSAYPVDAAAPSATGVPHVNIIGKLTFTTAGNVNISNIQLTTNSDNCIAITGTAASQLNLFGCFVNVTDATGIVYSSTSGSSGLTMYNCNGNVAATRTFLTSTGAGSCNFYYCNIFNSSTSASSTSTGLINIFHSIFYTPFSTSSSGLFFARNSIFDTAGINTAILTTAGTGILNKISNCEMNSGTASAISVGVNTRLYIANTYITSDNTNVITGAGTVTYSAITFAGASSTINTTSQTTCGTLVGSKNTAPSAGFLGEQLRAAATGVACTNATPRNITSVSLTAGVWDVSINSYCIFTGNCTAYKIGISATSATFLAADGDSQTLTGAVSGANVVFGCAVPSYRVTLTATTTYYLVAQANFTSGTAAADGRISATRVG